MGAAASQSSPVIVDIPSDDGFEAGFYTDKRAETADLAVAAAAALNLETAAAAPQEASEPQSQVDEVRKRVHDYELQSEVLGEGAFGTVRLATSRTTGHKVAVKLIRRQKLERRAEELLAREVKHHELLRHENIVRLFTAIVTPSKYYLVMEYAPKGDLLGFINDAGTVADGEARALFSQLLRGIAFCHSLGIHHRDIKLENLLLVELPPPSSELVLKITDFGLSELRPIGLSATCCGSPLYAAPELLSGEARPAGYDASASDMWSVGVILYALLCSSLPFDSGDMRGLLRLILRGAPLRPVPPTRGAAAAGLVRALLDVAPSKRLSAAAALEHEWCVAEWAAAPEPPALRTFKSHPTELLASAAAESAAAEAAPADDEPRRGVTEASDFFKRLLAAERGEAATKPPAAAPALPEEPEQDDEAAATRERGSHLTRADLEQIRATRAAQNEASPLGVVEPVDSMLLPPPPPPPPPSEL